MVAEGGAVRPPKAMRMGHDCLLTAEVGVFRPYKAVRRLPDCHLAAEGGHQANTGGVFRLLRSSKAVFMALKAVIVARRMAVACRECVTL